MPATVLRCTAFFGSNEGKGWSETHDRNLDTVPSSLLTYLQDFKGLMEATRVPLLGMDCRLEALRVSYKTATGATKSSPFKYSKFVYPSNKNAGAGPPLAAKARIGTTNNENFSDIYLRGFWDDIEANEQLDLDSSKGSQWKILFDQYLRALSGAQPTYGWNGINEDATPRGNVTTYTVAANGIVTFTLEKTNGAAWTPFLDSKPHQVIFSKINNSKSVLNRDLVVKFDSETSCKTVAPIFAGPFTGEGTFIAPVRQFYAYTGLQYLILGRRAMGRPITASRGRARVKQRT